MMNMKFLANTPSVFNRGCLQLVGTSVAAACSQANSGISPRDCQICTSNRCNGSTQLTLSFFVLLLGFISIFM